MVWPPSRSFLSLAGSVRPLVWKTAGFSDGFGARTTAISEAGTQPVSMCESRTAATWFRSESPR